jgi:hypothetical protein
LPDWGRHEFDRTTQPEIRADTDEFIDYIEHRRVPEESRPRLIQEIRELALREGGWTAYGAWDVLIAFWTPCHRRSSTNSVKPGSSSSPASITPGIGNYSTATTS